MKTIQKFIEENKIRMTAARVDRNPNMEDMPDGSAHYQCRFTSMGRTMTVYFSMGPACKGEPTAAEVLDCLATDSASVENSSSFEDWAADLGYDPDSRKAEKAYQAVEKQSRKLKVFLRSDDLYDELLFHIERG
jgi:hypothetical protein